MNDGAAAIASRGLPSLGEALRLLDSGAATTADLVGQCVERAAAWQPHTNAFIDQRHIAPAALSGPLAGIPLAHKDMYYRAGRISTCGTTLRRDWVAPVTATALARLDAAGAIDLGTLGMSEWAGGATGHNIHFGDVGNPWNPRFITGGSSSGSAAAVASGAVFAALGSDTGGSIRVPAACCGIAGLKPTWGRVSRFGAMPRAPSLDCVGPLARSVEDIARIMAVISGPDPADPTAADIAVPDYIAAAQAPARGMTIAVPDGWFFDSLHPGVAAALEAARAVFQRLGVRVIGVSLSDLPAIFDLQAVISVTEAAAIHRPLMAAHPEGYAAGLFGRQQTGLAMPATTYQQALSLRGPMLDRFCQAAFAKADALFVPGLSDPVPTLAESDVESGPDYGTTHARLVRNTRAFNYLGLPVLSVPCGFTANGLPTGFQLAGRPFAEATLIRLGAAFQRATDWHTQHPELPRP